MVTPSTEHGNLHDCNSIAIAAARKAGVGELLQCFPHTIARAPKRVWIVADAYSLSHPNANALFAKLRS